MGQESFDIVRFDLGPLLQGQTRIAKLESAHNSLIIGRTGLGWQTNLQVIMGQESFDIVRFDLGPLLQGQTRIAKLESAHNSLIMSTPPGGWIYYFCFLRRPMSVVRCPASRMVSAHLKEKY